jgi:hypothetical protein
VAPADLVQEFAHVIAMVFYPQSTFDQIGDPSTTPSGIRAPWLLASGDERVDFSVSMSAGVADPVRAWPSGHPARRIAMHFANEEHC